MGHFLDGAQFEDHAMPQTSLSMSTRGQGLYEFTDQADDFVRHAGAQEGLLTVFVRHTSCSLIIQENADPDVKRDLKVFFSASSRRVTIRPWHGSPIARKGPMTCRPI